MPRPALVLLGEFGRAHGLKGEVRLKSYTADPMAIGRYGPLFGPDGRTFVIGAIRQAAGDQPDLLVVRVEGVTSREAAEALNRVTLGVPRERLDTALDEDEFLLADLVGLAVVDPQGAPLGTIAAMPNYGGGDLLEIRMTGGARELVPFTKAFVPEVDIAAGRVVVAMPVENETADDRPSAAREADHA